MSVIEMHLDSCTRISKGKRKCLGSAEFHLEGNVHLFVLLD